MRLASSDVDGVVDQIQQAGRALAGEPLASRHSRTRDSLVDRAREAQKRLRTAVRRPGALNRAR